MILYGITDAKLPTHLYCYIGKTCDFERRKRQHFNTDDGMLIHNKIQDRPSDFTMEVILEDVPDTDINCFEKLYIQTAGTHWTQGGYNLTWGGDGLDSETARRYANERVAHGTHNFLDSEFQRQINLKRVENGTHPFLGGELQRQRVKDRTHNFLGKTWRDNPNATPHTISAWEDADEIVRLNQSGMSKSELGRRYKVSRGTIRNIIQATLRNSQPEQLELFL